MPPRDLELRLSKVEERTIAHDRSLTAIRNLLHTGIKMLVSLEDKVNGLADSHVKLYGTMQQVLETQKEQAAVQREQAAAQKELFTAQKELWVAQKELSRAQRRTEEALRRLIEHRSNGKPSS